MISVVSISPIKMRLKKGNELKNEEINILNIVYK